MDATWTMYLANQKFFTERAQQQFAAYLDEAFKERQHFYKKKAIMTDELIPTLIELVHLEALRPTCESGLTMYEQTRKDIVTEVLRNLGETNQLLAVHRKLVRMDPWSELEEVLFEDEELAEDGNDLMGGHVANSNMYVSKAELVDGNGNVLSMAEFDVNGNNVSMVESGGVDSNDVSMVESGGIDGGVVDDDFARRYHYDLDLFDVNDLLRWASH
jgi:hypothetical protein